MPDVFISYSSRDSKLARWLYDRLRELNVDVFLAEISLQGGTEWKPEIFENLRQSDFVLFLATPNSCASDAVKHEIGGALALKKTFVPILAGVGVNQLPSWVQDKQAIDIRDNAHTVAQFDRISTFVTSKRFIAGLIAGAIICGGLYLFIKKD